MRPNKSMKRKDLKEALFQYLWTAEHKGQVFYGIKRKSKTFMIREVVNDLIIIEYDSYPRHYVLEINVLLDGITIVLEKKIEIHLTSDYASKIEYSTINRSGINNKTSILTKFYYSIHRAFLKYYE